MKQARDFEDLDSIDTELDRLRALVEKAYSEGWYDGYVHKEKIIDNHVVDGWKNSMVKKELNK